MKSDAIAAMLSSLNEELGRLNDLQGTRYVSTEEWEPVRIVLRAYDAIGNIRAEDVDHARLDRINGDGGTLSWCGHSFAKHPDRCECQGNDPIPHRHYSHAPYGCARCGKCPAYSPVKAVGVVDGTCLSNTHFAALEWVEEAPLTASRAETFRARLGIPTGTFAQLRRWDLIHGTIAVLTDKGRAVLADSRGTHEPAIAERG